jgi:hypothetical protein
MNIKDIKLNDDLIGLIHKGGRIAKGNYLLFKTGQNKQSCIEPGDIMQGVFVDSNSQEVYATVLYNGGDVCESSNYKILTQIKL